MTKNELMRLLGIESLMKKNTKLKQYETMLDIICDFLIIQKDVSGGVDVPSSLSDTATTASSGNTIVSSKAVEPLPKRTGSVLQKKTQPAIPA